MGRVFTWSEVEAKKVPSSQQFQQVLDYLKNSAESDSSILGMIACGSLIRGDRNIRSDLDCFVFYDVDLEDQAFIYMQRSVKVASGLYVPLECIPLDTGMVNSNMHHIGPLFYGHLERSLAGGDIFKGREALDLICVKISDQEEVRGYLAHKLCKLQSTLSKMSVMSEEEESQCLQKFLEAPVHVARKVMLLSGVGSTNYHDSKSEVTSRYKRYMAQDLNDQLEELIQLDDLCTVMLRGQIVYCDEFSYKKCHEYIRSQIPKVIKFVRANIHYLDNLELE